MHPSDIRSEVKALLWENNQENIPKKGDAPRIAVDYLSKHPEAFISAPHQIVALVHKLETTDLTKSDMSDADFKTLSIMMSHHPGLFENVTFPTVMLALNDAEATVKRCNLIDKSSAFRSMFEAKSLESKGNRIEIKLENISKDSFIDFCNYLEKGSVNVTGDNAFELLELAVVYNVEGLRKNVIHFLTSTISDETFTPIFDGGLKTLDPDILRECIWFILTNKNKIIIQEGEEFKETKEFVDFVNTSIYFYDKSRYDLAIKDLNISRLILEALKSVNILKIALRVNVDNDQFNELIGKFQQVDYVYLSNNSISNIETDQKLGLLECISCPNLTKVKATNAEEAYLTHCKELEFLDASNARQVRVKRCPKLKKENITVPKDCRVYITPS